VFKKVTMVLSKRNLFTPREISLLKKALEECQLASSKYTEIDRHQLLKKIPAISYSMDNCKEINDA